MLLASFPSPSRSVWDLGPIPIRAYALSIIVGIVAAIWIGERRWVARGGKRGTVSDIAVWAVIFGLVGGRLYHVISDNELYFRAGKDPWRAFYVWEGGLGVWGAIALGGVGAWIGCHRRGIKLPPFADACAPGIAVAQGIGRWGNYVNQELFGRPTNVPWAVRIDPDRPSTVPGATGYHPTFLYESLWDVGLAGVLIYVDRRFKLGRGRVFALYVMGYTAGRVWIEMLRIDTANHILGLRLNVWTSILVFLGGLAYFLLHPGPRETEVEPDLLPTDGPADATDATDATQATQATQATEATEATDATDAADAAEAAEAADARAVDEPAAAAERADEQTADDKSSPDKSSPSGTTAAKITAAKTTAAKTTAATTTAAETTAAAKAGDGTATGAAAAALGADGGVAESEGGADVELADGQTADGKATGIEAADGRATATETAAAKAGDGTATGAGAGAGKAAAAEGAGGKGGAAAGDESEAGDQAPVQGGATAETAADESVEAAPAAGEIAEAGRPKR